MRNTQTMAFNEGASAVPQELVENAAEAGVRTIDLCKNALTEIPDRCSSDAN